MERFFDKISLVIGGAGLMTTWASFSIGEYIYGGVFGVLTTLLLFSGFTGGKK